MTTQTETQEPGPSTTRTPHQHRPTTTPDIVPYTYCANPARCAPAAHGWATLVETCHRAACPLERRINFNGAHRERGRWDNPSIGG